MPAPSHAPAARREPPWRAGRRLAGLIAALALAATAACAKRPGDLVTAAPAAEASPAPEAHFAGEDAERLEDARPDLDAAPADALALADYERLLGEQEARLRGLGRPGETRESERATRAPTGGAWGGGGAAGGDTVAESPPPSAPPRANTGKAPSSSPTASKSATPTAKSRKKEAATRADEGDACLMICDIAAATCDLEQKICDLAARHPADARYAQVCARARDDCHFASRSCEGCAA